MNKKPGVGQKVSGQTAVVSDEVTLDVGFGKIVQLASGGPRMTVTKHRHVMCDAVETTKIDTIWFTKTGEVKDGSFPQEALRKYDPSKDMTTYG